MIDVDEARARLFAAAPRLAAETVPLAHACGRTLAAPVRAVRSQPPADVSAMDGYAVDAAHPIEGVEIIGESRAGAGFHGALSKGSAVRIFTGAPLPPGANAVLIQEDAAVEGTRLTARESVTPGAHVRRAGLDFAAGDDVLPAGRVLNPRHLALAASAGGGVVSVARRPRVAFLATGDELVPPGAPVGRDQIVASTTLSLIEMVRAVGAEGFDLGIAPDDTDAIADAAARGLSEADILVTLGGASVGDHDLVAPALSRLGVALDFWKVAVRPGKPLMFASKPLVLGLPGNPVSGLVCTLLFLLPLLRVAQGGAPGPELEDAVLGAPLSANGPRRDHVRAKRVEGRMVPFSRQDSSMLGVLSEADGLIVRMPHASAAQAGDPCKMIRL
ncbi:MAG: molybdopterin molybdotransferase MoeA [Pseudomonadota bacterium]